MNHIWYISPSSRTAGNLINWSCDLLYLLADDIAVHLDRCGVSFHIADRWLTIDQQFQEFTQSNAVHFLPLDPALCAGPRSGTALLIAKAIVFADGKQWQEPSGTRQTADDARDGFRLTFVSKKGVKP